MKPQSVLTRVKMFENKRSASLENKKDVNDTASFKVSFKVCLSPSLWYRLSVRCVLTPASS
jgi:hypothetical protein